MRTISSSSLRLKCELRREYVKLSEKSEMPCQAEARIWDERHTSNEPAAAAAAATAAAATAVKEEKYQIYMEYIG